MMSSVVQKTIGFLTLSDLVVNCMGAGMRIAAGTPGPQ
jgi:hypothetical protein